MIVHLIYIIVLKEHKKQAFHCLAKLLTHFTWTITKKPKTPKKNKKQKKSY